MPEPDETLDRLAQEYVRRLRAGEDVEPEAYAEAHPALAERIHELFPVLVMMEGLKPPSQSAATPPTVAEGTPAAAGAEGAPVRIGPFVVERELGRGGMGRVYEVRDGGGVRRALKVVHPHLLERPGFLARFLREVETGLRVDHAGVVHTIESGVAEYEGAEVPYLVLEYVEGTTLRSLLDETGGVSERLAREIGIAVADALAAIHAAGIVHRDVKPENVVIAPDETVKVMDLGVALVQEEAMRLTQTGEFVGSLLYAAPEQLRSGRVDARSDLYALGLLLFELLAGKHPAAEGTGSLLMRRFAGDGPGRLRERVPSATPFLERVVETLLAREPDKRFASAQALVEVLRAGESGAWWAEQEAARRQPARPRRFVEGPAFTGRADELAILEAAYARTRDGAGEMLLIVGEGGMGKSRLVSSWLDRREHDEAPPTIVWLEHGPGAGALGLAPLAHAVTRLLGDALEARVRAALGEQTEAAETLLRHLAAPDAPKEGASLGRASLEALYRQLLRAVAAEGGLVVVVEDLHFAAAEVRAWLDRLLPALAEDPVLVIATTRPGVVDPWLEQTAARERVTRLSLQGLPAEDGAALFMQALGGDLAELVAAQDVVRHADGNPFCLIEFAEELRAQAKRPGARSADRLAMPDSIQRVVEERLQALSADERDLLAVAACCGDRFDPLLACEAAGVPRIAGLRMLHAADRRHRVIAAEGNVYRFRHHLVQEGLHGELPPALRGTIHTALAAAREARVPEGELASAAEAYAIARHFLLGDEPARARPYLQAGVEHLLAHAELRRAERMARRALEALPELPPAERARLLLARARALDGRTDPEEILQLAQGALAAAEQVEDDRLLVASIRAVGASCARAGRHAQSWPYAARSVEVAERLGDPALLAMTLDDLSSCLFDQGKAPEAIATGERAILHAREGGDVLEAARAMMTLAGYAAERGRLEEARTRAEFALTTSHLHGDRDTERFSLGVLARMAHAQCDFEGAYDLCRRLHRMGREEGNLRMVASSQMAMAHLEFNRGNAERARELAGRSDALLRRMGYRELGVLLGVTLMLVEHSTGNLGRAVEIGGEVQGLLEHVPLSAVGARVHPRLATQLAWQGAFDEAAEHVAIGRAKAVEASVAREQLMARQSEASLLDARGDTAGAAEAYGALYRDAQQGELTMLTALIALRLGGLHVRLGHGAEAREALDAALAIAEPSGLRTVVAEGQVWRELLPGGQPATGRVLLEREQAVIPAHARVRLWRRLGERLEEPALIAKARTLCERLIASAPEAQRECMRRDVPLYRETLA